MPFLLAREPRHQRADLAFRERVDEGVDRGKHEAFTHGHLEQAVLLERRTREVRREEGERAMWRLRRRAERVQDAQEQLHMRHLFVRLAGEELRRLEVGRDLEPVADLHARYLAVEVLRED